MIQNPNARRAILDGDFSIGHLGLELTRRCNFLCEHCYHGDAQNFHMSLDTMNALFEQHKKSIITRIFAMGGEHSKDLETLELFLKALEKNKTKFDSFGLVSNGYNLPNDFFQIIDAIGELSEGKKANINISNDFWHFKEYERLGTDYNAEVKLMFSRGKKFKHIDISKNINNDGEKIRLYKLGRAAQINDKETEFRGGPYRNGDNIIFKRGKGQNEDAFLEYIDFDAKGNCLKYEIDDYDHGEKSKVFNICRADAKQNYLKHGIDR